MYRWSFKPALFLLLHHQRGRTRGPVYPPFRGGLVCEGMIGDRASRQSTVDSPQSRVRKETPGKRFNAEDAESTEFAEPELECGRGKGMGGN
jgi:hypothetical protein